MEDNKKQNTDELMHYGTKFHSGRYPYGSGEEPYQHAADFLNRINELEKSGLSQVEIGKYFGLSSGDFRKEKSIALNEQKYLELQKIRSLKNKGYSNYKIGEIMGMNESSVRGKLKGNTEAKKSASENVYNLLKEEVAKQKYIDVGAGVERDINVSRARMDEALYRLQMEGYKVYNRFIDTPNPNKKITVQVLCPPGTKFEDISNITGEIGSLTEFKSCDGGDTPIGKKFVYPKSMDSKRLMIRYADDVDSDGTKGIEKDGVIEIRRGVDDLSLGGSRYAQCRILVDGTHYLKGMAVYSDDIPDGVDVVFNTNKDKSVSKMDVLKKIGNDPDNPFGATISSQVYYDGKDGKKELGLINKKSDEGDWEDWTNCLPAQFLSKQSKDLAKRQLGLAIEEKMKMYDEICSYTNPTVKKKMLEDFAGQCDSDAVHLRAAALPKQKYHVIIPINSLKDNEVYAPNYDNGEKLALVRYPHGGTFEIPILTVNNNNKLGKKLLGSTVSDAIGINANVAARLSGADFDGDTVMAIPTNDKVRITSTEPLEGLKGFEAKFEYKTTEKNGKYYNQFGDEVKIMPKNQIGKQMGMISNLITDMTLIGATNEELARAVRHSMTVIDAAKHKLDYKQSEIDNRIQELRERYQGRYNEESGRMNYGAATLISKAGSQQSITRTKGTPHINKKGNYDYDPSKPEGALIYKKDPDAYFPDYIKKDGKIQYKLTNGNKTPLFDPKDKETYDYYKPVRKYNKETKEYYYTNKTGDLMYKTGVRTIDSTKMAETDDARTLISKSNTVMENLYADYANKLKALANQARKESAYTKEIRASKSASETYANEVKSLDKKIMESMSNQTKERRANILASSEFNAKKEANPDMTKEEQKKLRTQALNRARETVGAKRVKIDITDREWEAIQSGAITKTKLNAILNCADMDKIRERCIPKSKPSLTNAQIIRIKNLSKNNNYTIKEIASKIGVSTSTISDILKGKE